MNDDVRWIVDDNKQSPRVFVSYAWVDSQPDPNVLQMVSNLRYLNKMNTVA